MAYQNPRVSLRLATVFAAAKLTVTCKVGVSWVSWYMPSKRLRRNRPVFCRAEHSGERKMILPMETLEG